MIGVDKIQDIREMYRNGEPIARIARKVGVCEPTARKYAKMEDLSPEMPRKREPRHSSLEGFERFIDEMLEEDRRCWRKQRHTAVRILDRLRNEHGFKGSYSTVQRYVKEKREEMAAERDARGLAGFLALEWLPGECQVDFGEADFRVRGVVTRGKYLTVSFPHSNVGLTQVFWGETAECVCEGLANVFEFIGGVPGRAVFDNATGIGRRVGDEIRLSELFRLFCAHYGLSYSFTNPYSGNEKGNVENKVGTHRRNMFVPVPAFSDVEAFNRRLLEQSLSLSDGKPHWRKGTPELDLFEEDRAALSALAPQRFSCRRWETRKCSKQGTFTLGGIHRYCAGPAWAGKEVAVSLGAFHVEVFDPKTGDGIASYEREWGQVPTDSADPVLQLRLLCLRPGGWRDSVVRKSLPEELVAFLDAEPKESLSESLRTLRDESAEHGWKAAVEGMQRALGATGGLGRASVSLCAANAASGDARIDYGKDAPDLGMYDVAMGIQKGGAADAAVQL